MGVVRALREAGIIVEDVAREPSADAARSDAILAITVGDARARFAVESRGRAPYPNELSHLDARLGAMSREGQPLLVVPFVSESLGAALTRAGWSWADAQGNFDMRAQGLVLCQRRTTTPPRSKRSQLPQGSGSLSIIRTLIRLGAGHEMTATGLAATAQVSQPRASQVLHQLADLGLVERSRLRTWAARREALLDRFLSDYAGPRGSELHLYSLDTPTEVAIHAASTRSSARPLVVSADVGPDLLVPWRRPSLVIVYVRHDLDPTDLGLVQAQGRHDANVIIRNPQDLSVFPPQQLVAEVAGSRIPLADPAQQIWDLQDLGGADRLEAAGMLREWLLSHP